MAVVLLTTAPDLKTAKSIAKLLLKKKAAACVSLKDGFLSYYWWKAKIESARETLLLVKTTEKKFRKAKEIIQDAHPYEVPEIISLPITQGSSEYLAWLRRVLN